MPGSRDRISLSSVALPTKGDIRAQDFDAAERAGCSIGRLHNCSTSFGLALRAFGETPGLARAPRAIRQNKYGTE
jgi:hypothetical protein